MQSWIGLDSESLLKAQSHIQLYIDYFDPSFFDAC